MAIRVGKLIEKNRGIPRTLINIVESKTPCGRNKNSVIHLCITGGEMKLLHINQTVVLGILKEFNGEEQKYGF